MGRKTCPTYRGLRHLAGLRNRFHLLSEDLPHSSGIKTEFFAQSIQNFIVGRLAPLICLSSFSDDLKPRSSENVGKPAPLIGDKNQTALMVRSIKAVFASGVLSSCLDNAVLPVAEYDFLAQVQPLPDIQHLREGGRKVGQLPCADCAAKGRNLLLTVGKTAVFVP